MKFIKLVLSVLASVVWIFSLNHAFKIDGNALPPIGKFLSPALGIWKNIANPDPGFKSLVSNLPAEGSVYFDDRMVPHIFASSIKDAYFIQGYVHAMHRMWQMDFSTRAAEGRISEIIGEKALEFDKTKRRKGLKESALASLENWKKYPEVYALIQSYADGYNAYLKAMSKSDLPIEYKLMDFEPELWSPYRSSLFHKSMAEILCGRDQDVELSNARFYFGDEFNYFFNEMDSLTDPIIPKGTNWNFTSQNTLQHLKADTSLGYIDWIREPSGSGIGSNNWAVGPSKSVTGNPILCNDPHLSLTLPSIWYEQQIQVPEMNVYGVTFPGVPGVVIGFNKDISWGVTNAGWDVMDWYKIKWKDESKSHYELDGKWVETKIRVERIKIKGCNDVLDTVRITNWGPIVFEDMKHKKYGLAMHWIIQDTFDKFEFRSFFDLDKGKNYKDYRDAISQFPYPAQNFAFASASGDIGITVQGKMPKKFNQQGRFVQNGSDSKNAWDGFINNENNPASFNPPRGFISSANQRSTDLSFPNYFNNGDFRDYRGTLINRLLSNKEKWSIEDMKALQYNNYSLRAETALPEMLRLLNTDTLDIERQAVFNKLKAWDYNYDSTKIEPVYFDVWFETLYKMVWDEINLDSTKKATALPSDETTIQFLKEKPNHGYFDLIATPIKEDAKKLVRLAFDSLILMTKNQLDVKDWASYKDASIAHLAKIPAFGKYHIRTSGSKDIINAHGKIEGPSWRMIVEMKKDQIHAFGIYPGGQSGNPGSKFYDQMIFNWSKGAYYELKFLDSIPVEENAYAKMIFKK
ncbi:MAG: penicillin acylase family protein [Saprospiraceae bacterium]|nr:penicillin acylase family protein [Saprospiraceae bacterium]MBK9720786.1 penicillin acylase family protein [Saprospiraceae bacterium]